MSDSKITVFDWSDEKDFKLRKERGIGFDDIVFHIASGDFLGVVSHPNEEKYPNQKIFKRKILKLEIPKTGYIQAKISRRKISKT